MSKVALPPIEQSTPSIELTYDFVRDVTNVLDMFVPGSRVHRDEDVKFISNLISNIVKEYKIRATNEFDFKHHEKNEHFIRILRYGVLFKYVVMLKLPDGTIESITYGD